MNNKLAVFLSTLILFSSVAGCLGNSNDDIDIDEILSEIDGDSDGVLDVVDLCPDTLENFTSLVNQNGCYDEGDILDSDNDGVVNNQDLCDNTDLGEQVFLNGCSVSQLDSDGDGVIDIRDECPNSDSNLPTLPNGCNQEEMVSGVALRVFAQDFLNYKISTPADPILFAFNMNRKIVTNVGSFTTDNDSQFVIGTIYEDGFFSPLNDDLMIHYTGESYIENMIDYIESLESTDIGGYGGLHFRTQDDVGFLQFELQYYIWAIPKIADVSFFDPPSNLDNLGPNICEQPPVESVPFSLPNGEIKDLSLYDFTGKVVVLEIGAEWCGPCKLLLQEMNELNSLAVYNDKVQFLSMSVETIDGDEMTISEARNRQMAEEINFPVSGQNHIANYYLNNVGGGLPIVMIFTMDMERGFNMLTVASVVGATGLELFDTISEVNDLLNGNYVTELCKDHEFAEFNPFDNTFDDDGDGVANYLDMFPEDPNEYLDFDGDGVGDNADDDDDGDGTNDEDDMCPNTDMSSYVSYISILHNDGCADIDGDRYNSTVDCDDYNAFYTIDSDGDDYCDEQDDFPHDESEWSDADGDGVGDNSDAFPNDPHATYDSDNDGVRDPVEFDYDDGGIAVSGDLCPNTPDGVDVDEFGCPDLDEDGWYYGDCDDNNSDIFPGANEIQDSADNDCDGLVDEVTPPLVITVEISPSDVFTNSEIECFGNSSTGENVPLYLVINGIQYEQRSFNYVMISPGGYLSKGDVVTCFTNGLLSSSESYTVWDRTIVANSPPELSGVSLNQLNNGTIVCDVGQSNSIDPDGDSVNFSYQWFIDGQLSEVTNSYLLSSDYIFSEGADVTCIVTPNDGDIDGSAVSKTIALEVMEEDEPDDAGSGGSGGPDDTDEEV